VPVGLGARRTRTGEDASAINGMLEWQWIQRD